MEKNWEQLPTIDWELAKRLAGNQVDLAHDMLNMLTRDLPNDLFDINQAFKNKDMAVLYQRVHKLHGAVSYCGTPRLKAVLASIDLNLKNNSTTDLPLMIQEFDKEVKQLLREHEANAPTKI